MALRPSSRVRSGLTVVAGVIAVLGIVAGALGLWIRNTVYDSAAVGRFTYEELARPEVADAISLYVVDQVATAVDLRQQVIEAVPESLVPVADFLLAGVRSRIEDRVSQAIQSEPVREVVAVAVARSHAAAVDLLRGDGLVDGVTVVEGEVTLNLLPLVSRVLLRVQELGLLSDVDIPELDRSGDPDEQRAELEAALGRDLPEEFGEVVVYRSESLAEAGATLSTVQRLLVTIDRALWMLLLGGLGLAVATVFLSRRRPRAVVWLTASVMVGLVVARLLVGAAARRVPSLIERPGIEIAVSDALSSLADRLTSTAAAYLGLGLLVIGTALVVGRRSPAPQEPTDGSGGTTADTASEPPVGPIEASPQPARTAVSHP